MIRILSFALALALVGAAEAPAQDVDGLWRYSHARCPEADVVPQGYVSILVIQGDRAAQETEVSGCASQTLGITRRWTPDGAVLRYTGASTSCTPGPQCFGSFTTTVLGRVASATFSCSAGPTWGESGPFTVTSNDTLESPIPGERGCTSVYVRIPGPTGLVP